MNAYDSLAIVDQYEEKHGNSPAVLLACKFMAEYLSCLDRVLPETISQALDVAQGYLVRRVSLPELSAIDDRVSISLKQLMLERPDTDAEVAITQAIDALLKLLRRPIWGGGASEVLSNFLDCTDLFGGSHAKFEKSLSRTFASSMENGHADEEPAPSQ